MQHAIITGELVPQELLDTLTVFNESFQTYTVDKMVLKSLKNLTQETEITTIVGTWCPDCFREVSRLIKVLAHLDNPKIKARYIGVDRNKLDDAGLAAQFDFSRIPTIIVRQKGQEIGRIVESPSLSLEQDLLKILAKG
jgi:thiol-disulfide isomerase/thioredoxin